jgi:hypothetical protein
MTRAAGSKLLKAPGTDFKSIQRLIHRHLSLPALRHFLACGMKHMDSHLAHLGFAGLDVRFEQYRGNIPRRLKVVHLLFGAPV